jgi:hypothetical protein
MRVEASVQLGQRLLVTNRENECELPCIIVFVGARLGGGIDVAFSFTAAMPYFWRSMRTRKFDAPEIEWDCEGSTLAESSANQNVPRALSEHQPGAHLNAEA